MFIEQRLCREHHTAEAEAALGRFLIDERLLNRVRFFRRSQAIQRRDLLLFYRADWHHAGAHRLPAYEDRAGPALCQAAAELGSAQLQFVAEHIQQRSFRIDLHRVDATVYLQRNGSHHLPPTSQMTKLTTGSYPPTKNGGLALLATPRMG